MLERRGSATGVAENGSAGLCEVKQPNEVSNAALQNWMRLNKIESCYTVQGPLSKRFCISNREGFAQRQKLPGCSKLLCWGSPFLTIFGRLLSAMP
jgi:hypothetical protein